MKKQVTLTCLAAALLALALLAYGCGKGSDDGPFAPSASTSSGTVSSNSTTTPPEPAAEPAPEDASGGRVLWARWPTGKAPWLAQFFNDTNNTGAVAYCVYDLKNGFAAQGPPVFEAKVTVPPGTAYGDIELDIYDVVSEEWCGAMDFQADLIRGGVCGEAPAGHGGYNFGATFGKLERECECEPQEPKIVSQTTEPSDPEAGWGACDQAPGEDVRIGCFECRDVSITTVWDDGCEKRTSVEEKTERREIACPTCEDYEEPKVDLTWSVVTQEDPGGLLATGHLCDAKYSGVIKPSVCSAPFNIDPAFPFLVKWDTTQLFTFKWAGTYTPEGTRLQCPMDLTATDLVDPGPEPCEEPYAGTPSRDRISFIAKDKNTGLYVWRIHNAGQHAAITAKGPGFERTFDVEGETVGFFTTDAPVAGMSIYTCDGTLLHGTASSNETEKNFCDFEVLLETECPALDGTCFYNLNEVVGGQDACFAAPGYLSWNEQNHLCELEFPGVSLKGWNLNPGQSAEGCLSKNDD